MAEDWGETLRSARLRLKLSQQELARLASVSTESIRAYEQGRRAPRRASITAVLDALKLNRQERNQILVSYGFVADGVFHGPDRTPGYFLSLDEARAIIESCPWPAYLANDFLEIEAANRIAQLVWDVDLDNEFTTRPQRNLLAISSMPRFANRCLNWDEVMSVMISIFKGHHMGPEQYEQPSPNFGEALERFLAGDPAYVGRFPGLWEAAEPMPHKARWSYRMRWKGVDDDPITFLCFASVANEADGFAFNDWIPADWASFQRLDRLVNSVQSRQLP